MPTQIAPPTRTATTTRRGNPLPRRRKTGSSCRFAPANGFGNPTLEVEICDSRLATGDWRLEGRALLTAIVFDFDGVIADTEPLHYRAFRDVLADEGVELTTRDYFDRYLGFTDAGVFREIAADRGYVWTADHIAAFASRKADRFDLIEHDG